MNEEDRQGLLEREAELAELGAALKRAREAQGGAVLIEGAAGVGKTQLLGAAQGLARERDMRVLDARGTPLERDFAWGLVRQIFEPLLAATSEGERDELFGDAARAAEPVFEPLQDAASRPTDTFAILHGLYWLTVNASDDRPLLIAADDLHWADRPSLRFLAHLAVRLDGLPILVVGTARPAEPDMEPLLLALGTVHPAMRRIEPRALSEGASAQLVRRWLSPSADGAFCDACHEASGGNPLLLTALVRELERAGIPPTASRRGAILELGAGAVADLVRVNLSRVDAATAAFARAAAVLGDGTSFGHVATLAEIGEEAMYEAVANLNRLEIIDGGPRIGFVHPLVRGAIYEGLEPGRRERAHARAARVLAEIDEAPERRAAHLMRTVPRGDAATVEVLRVAARAALAGGASEAAVTYLRRAHEEPPPGRDRADVLFELGSAETLVEGRVAADHLEEAVLRTEDGRMRAERADLLARTLFFAGQPSRAIEVAQRELAELGESAPELRRRLQATLLFAALMDPDLNGLADSLQHVVEALDADGMTDLGAKSLLGSLAYRQARACVPASEVVPRAEQAVEGGVLIAEDNGGGASMLAPSVLALADSELALPIYDAGIEAARRSGSVFGYISNKIFATQAHLLRGELRDAIADGEEALSGADKYVRFEDPRGEALRRFVLPWPVSFLAVALIEAGELDEAERILAIVSGIDEPVPATHNWHWFLDARSRLRVARGELRRGLEETLEAGRRFESVGGRNPAFLPWRSRAALCLVQLGEDPDRARELIEEDLALARRWGAPRAVGATLIVRGLVVGGSEGIGALREAVQGLEGSPARLELARAMIELGAALRRVGSRRESRDPLRRGHELAHRCGARPLVERAHTELRASGARPRPVPQRGAGALTPSELRVARLGASGLTNRAIAQRLFVTQKTVESHMRSIFRKLEIGSRTKLGDALEAGTENPGD